MHKRPDSEQEILSAIKDGGQATERALRQVYLNNRVAIGNLVIQNQGTEEEAKDVMQEAMIAFYENVVRDKYKAESTISTYLYSIARFIWLNQLKRNKRQAEKLEAVFSPEPAPELPRHILAEEQRQQVLHLFNRLGKDCQRVLMDSIYHNFEMKAIARKMGYDNEQVARNKKYICLKKLKTFIRDHPGILQLLKP